MSFEDRRDVGRQVLSVAVHRDDVVETLTQRLAKAAAQGLALAASCRVADQGDGQLTHDPGRAVVRAVVDDDHRQAQLQGFSNHATDGTFLIEAGNQDAAAITGGVHGAASIST